MKTVLVTIAIDGLRDVHELTEPSLQAYARKIDAEYVVVRNTKHVIPHFAKFDIFEKMATDGVDQLLYVDADIYIRKHAPNILAYHTSAMFSELPHPRPDWLRESTDWIRMRLDNNWPHDRYFNTGVIVADKSAIVAVAKQLQQAVPCKGVFFEQEQLNVLMHRAGFPLTTLEPKWNQFCCPEWITPERASRAFFLHATGVPVNEKLNTLDAFMKGYP